MTPSEPTPQRSRRRSGREPESVRSANHSRRAFLFKLSLLANGAVGAVLAVPIIGYLLGPAMKKSSSYDSWIALGPISDFPENETRLVNFRNPITTSWDGQTGDIPCWVRRVSGSTFQVFAINCAHLGCPVRWFAQSKLFLCPCHGGAYYADGSRASGPPERGLFEYDHKIMRQYFDDQSRQDAHARRVRRVPNRRSRRSRKLIPQSWSRIRETQTEVRLMSGLRKGGIAAIQLARTAPRPWPACHRGSRA